MDWIFQAFMDRVMIVLVANGIMVFIIMIGVMMIDSKTSKQNRLTEQLLAELKKMNINNVEEV